MKGNIKANLEAIQQGTQWALRNASAKYDKEAIALQHGCKVDEELEDYIADYNSKRVRLSVVHGRQDIVLLVSYMRSLNEQIDALRKTAGLIAILLGAILGLILWKFGF